MKVTFPHMGNLYVVVKALLEYLGVDVIVPPANTKRTLTLGTLHSPEFACLPLKVNVGNFIEAAELGADTIVMAGGVGPCRFGYYAQVQQEILSDLGYNYQMIVLEPPDTHYSELTKKIRYLTGNKSLWQVIKALKFAWVKARAIDILEEKVHKIRAREINQGEADRIFNSSLKEIDEAKNYKTIYKIQEETLHTLNKIMVDMEKPVIKIGLVGEIYTVLEPFANLHIEQHLGKLGVEVDRSIYLSQWVNDHYFMGLANIRSSKEAKKLAYPYLNHFVGGHGLETIGSTVSYARKGYHGVIQVAPLTCMPEIVAQAILPAVNEQEGIPSLTIYLDEQSGEAGIVTRLEAFVDLLFRKSEMIERRIEHESIFRN